MDFHFTPDELEFRDEVRHFLASHLPAGLADKVAAGQQLTRAEHELWHSILNERGWLAVYWPEEYGGPGWNAVKRFIFEYECGLAHAPRLVPFGLTMLGPVLIEFGTDAQKRHWLPRILSGADFWCQGYSEPGAGSDLASLNTTAVRSVDEDGEHYIVNGQKTWTTLAHYANMIFCLVRTDREAQKQRGISFLLIDMSSPGVVVRPIMTLDGEHEVNEVFFTNVRVPLANLVGAENQGWTCAKYLLTYERTNIARIGISAAALEQLRVFAARQTKQGRPLTEDPYFAARFAALEISLENLKTTNLRVLMAAAEGRAPGAESSILKVLGTQLSQEISSLYRRVMGADARCFVEQSSNDGLDGPLLRRTEAARAAKAYFNNRKLSIFGGSNEIQKNIISKRILEL
jgi:alkylation response protein AidB-like acyl-CoA dehydrogenase